jgi:hypothetical protein
MDGLASEYAWTKQGTSRPEFCADLAGDVELPQTNCVRCVVGLCTVNQVDP